LTQGAASIVVTIDVTSQCSSGLPNAAIAGIVIGAVVLVGAALVVGLVGHHHQQQHAVTATIARRDVADDEL
jgi:hypothetical protein